MTAERVLDTWFGGSTSTIQAQAQLIKPLTIKDRLQGLKPVSLPARVDFNRGLLFGRLKKHGFLFKRGEAWGNWPLDELAQFETMAITFFAHLDELESKGGKGINSSGSNYRPGPTEADMKKRLLSAKGFHQVMSSSQNGNGKKSA